MRDSQLVLVLARGREPELASEPELGSEPERVPEPGQASALEPEQVSELVRDSQLVPELAREPEQGRVPEELPELGLGLGQELVRD